MDRGDVSHVFYNQLDPRLICHCDILPKRQNTQGSMTKHKCRTDVKIIFNQSTEQKHEYQYEDGT